jgi:alpha-1,3-rhamnosyl/mannosyltransferase
MTGVGRAAYSLLAALARQPERPALRALFLPDSLPLARRDPNLAAVEPVEAPHSHESHPWGDLWLHRGLARIMRPGELYHGPAFLIPAGRFPNPRVVTIFDLFVITDPAAYPFKFRLWLKWTIRRACRAADRVLVPTRTIADQITQLRLAPADRIEIIPPAADTTPLAWETPHPDFDPFVASTDPPDAVRLLTIGTLDARKDPLTARRAALEFHRDRPDTRLDWVWIGGPGPGPDPSPPELVQRAAAAGLRAVGPMAGQAVRRALARAAAYVTCSRAEGFGIPLAEAFNAGCPVIAADLPVHREVAADAALYFNPGDPAALADALRRFLDDAALQAELRERSRRRASAFDWDRSAAATLSAYRRAAGNP